MLIPMRAMLIRATTILLTAVAPDRDDFLPSVPTSQLALSSTERRTAAQLQQRLQMTDYETLRLLVSHPSVLGYKWDTNIEPTLDALEETLALSADELKKVVKSAPSAYRKRPRPPPGPPR